MSSASDLARRAVVQRRALDIFRSVLEDDEQHIEDALGAAVSIAYQEGRRDADERLRESLEVCREDRAFKHRQAESVGIRLTAVEAVLGDVLDWMTHPEGEGRWRRTEILERIRANLEGRT